MGNIWLERVNALNVSRLEREYILNVLEDIEAQDAFVHANLTLDDGWDTYDLAVDNASEEMRNFTDAAFNRAWNRGVCRDGLILILEAYYEDAEAAYADLTEEV